METEITYAKERLLAKLINQFFALKYLIVCWHESLLVNNDFILNIKLNL